MEKWLEALRQNEAAHRSIPFWSWNDRLEEEELRRQIRNMKKMEMGGFFMHARGGLETQYQSRRWYDLVRACIDEGKKQGLEAWAYDENGWPSGFGGGELLKDPQNHAVYLRHELRRDIPAEALAAYTLDGRQVTEPCGEELCCIFMETDDSYVDTMDREITQKFIACTHAAYKKEIDAADFGTAMPGFFTDEPQYYRWGTPWSRKMPAEFQAAYGYPVWQGLAALFIDCPGGEEFRYDYYALCHRLFINSFIRPVYRWCEQNGVKVTGHPVEEASLGGQMGCCGGVMPFYQYEHIPGIDYLTRALDRDIAPKQLGSACAQLGKKQALSEMFGCCGWDVTPRELKKIAELQYVNGVNVMCQHLYPYSVRGQRKRDYPAFYSRHLPWQQELKDFNVYFNRLGSALSLGTEAVNALVIHPIRSAYLTYRRAGGDWGSGIERLEADFARLSDCLGDRQVAYHYGDETMMETLAEVENGALRVGLCRYEYVIIPACDTLTANTCRLLQAYLARGGKLCLFDPGHVPCRVDGRRADLSWLKGNCTLEDIRAAARVRTRGENKGLRLTARETENGLCLFAVNLSDERLQAEVTAANCCGLCRIDLAHMKLLPAGGMQKGGDTCVTLTLEAGQSCLLAEGETEAAACRRKPARLKLQGPFTLAQPPENLLTLDRCALSCNGRDWEPLRPIEQVRDLLLQRRYEGELWLKFPFTVKNIPPALRLCAEPVKGMAVQVNGCPVAMTGQPYMDFPTGDIAALVRPGENEAVIRLLYRQDPYVYRVLFGGVKGEALRNCLCFDTEVEAVYLLGDFRVETQGDFCPGPRHSLVYGGGFALDLPRESVCPQNLTEDGFPFFAGSITFTARASYVPGGPAWLELGGRWATAKVAVNGKPAARLLFETGCDLTEFLHPGENTLTVTLTNARRNQLGPHHGKDPEPYAVGPVTFSFEKQWTQEGCPAYEPGYAFVRFGIDL